MSVYLYGVVGRTGPAAKLATDVLGTGVGDPPASVELIPHDKIAALASTKIDPGEFGEAAGARGLRRDMAAHSDVLARALDHCGVLPARFGVLFPSVRVMTAQFLEPQHDNLVAELARLGATVELSIRAELIEQETIEAVARDSPEFLNRLQRSRSRPAGASYHERIELGRQIAVQIQARRDQESRWLLDRLSAAVLDVQSVDPPSDLTVFRGSVLINRKDLNRFDRFLGEIAQEAGSRMKLACTGPLPPYSFVDLHVPADGM